MRRKEREITDFSELVRILAEAEFMTLGLMHGGKPYSVPVNFGYRLNGDSSGIQIFIHGAANGQKIDCIRNCPHVSFCAVNSCSIMAGKEPCKWTSFYESVCGSGTAVILEDADEKKEGLVCILKKYGYRGASVFPVAMLQKMCVIRIDVSDISGKSHKK